MTWVTFAVFDDVNLAEEVQDRLKKIVITNIKGAKRSYPFYRDGSGDAAFNMWGLQSTEEDYEKAYNALQAIPGFRKYLVEFKPGKLGICTQCNTRSVKPKEIGTLFIALCVLFIGIPTFFYKTTYRCLQCGYEFKRQK